MMRWRTCPNRVAKTSTLHFVVIVLMSTVAQIQCTIGSGGTVDIVMETDAGMIEIRVDSVGAPTTATNFLRYVDSGLFDGGTFYRAVRADNQPVDSIKIAVIQGGMDPERRDQAFDPIRLEGTDVTGLRHLDGTISMARAGPHTARSAFFICIGDQPELDAGGRRNPDGFGFAAFGHVTGGMEVVKSIQTMPVDGQWLEVPVVIRRAVRRDRQ